ncbi:HU family DNA-binding protein, partial [Pseudomonas viridiflava]|uniref:HU family DNA-binding protein n=1 Tax=Pseudomonas viridiflava TaxID=33069 RepID=UPI001F13D604
MTMLHISQETGCSNSSDHAKTFGALTWLLEKEGKNMTKSELIERIVTHQGLLSSKDVELAIKTMLEQMSQCLATGDRIEIRGFGSFSLHYRAPRVGRN